MRERAIPLPAQFTKALAAVAIRQGDEKIGVALLLGGFMDACYLQKKTPPRSWQRRRLDGLVRFGSAATVGVA